jgi:hypothetical protein
MVASCGFKLLFPKAKDVEHIFMCLFSICIFFGGEMSIHIFCLFLSLNFLVVDLFNINFFVVFYSGAGWGYNVAFTEVLKMYQLHDT